MKPELIFILVVIVAPLIERLLKGAKQGGPPQQRPAPPQHPQAPSHQSPRYGDDDDAEPTVVVARRTADDETAATILPDDLWELLTGERRPPQTIPAPEPDASDTYEDASTYEVSADDDWGYGSEADAPPPVVRPREGIRSREEVRPPVYDAPAVVSLEKIEVTDAERHIEFHERLERLTSQRASRPSRMNRFATDEDLRRAIIASEILGPPKGLQ